MLNRRSRALLSGSVLVLTLSAMSFSRVASLIVVGLVCWQTCLAEQSKNPCHPNKSGEGAAGCEAVVVPPGLCAACPLRAPLQDGNFEDCTRIFNLDAKGCRTKLREYVKLNPCDSRRAALVEKWDFESKRQLDYFAYSLCEQCCDTVPKGAKAEQYEERNKDGTLWSLHRGNGPAHFVYDICTIFPNFKFFKLPWGTDHYDYPRVCENLRGWLNSGAAENWITNFDVQITEPVQRALADSMMAFECHNRKTWLKCVDLESKQGRI